LQRWVPEAQREVAAPAPVRPAATTDAGRCFRTVCALLAGEKSADLPSPFKAPELYSSIERAAVMALRGGK
jgi:hypothetical protein